MKSRVVLIGLLLLAAAGGGAWWWLSRPSQGGPVVLTGNVEVRQVNLGFKVAGRIPVSYTHLTLPTILRV